MTLGVAARLGYGWWAGPSEVLGWSRRGRGAGPLSASRARKAVMTMRGSVMNLGARRVVGVGGLVRGIVKPCCVYVVSSVVAGLAAVVVVDSWLGSAVHGVGVLLWVLRGVVGPVVAEFPGSGLWLVVMAVGWPLGRVMCVVSFVLAEVVGVGRR